MLLFRLLADWLLRLILILICLNLVYWFVYLKMVWIGFVL